MRTSPVSHYAGWSAYINAVANVVGFVSLALFFAAGEPFGTINDSSSVLLALSFIPLTLTLHALHRPLFPRLSLIATAIGIIAMLTAALLQALLVLGTVQFEQTLRAVLAANAVIGAWLVVSGILARVGATLPIRLAWVAIIPGSGLVLVILGFWIGGEQHPLAAVGGVVAFVGLLIWAIWLGRLLRQEAL